MATDPRWINENGNEIDEVDCNRDPVQACLTRA
jgi:hypothetical protein